MLFQAQETSSLQCTPTGGGLPGSAPDCLGWPGLNAPFKLAAGTRVKASQHCPLYPAADGQALRRITVFGPACRACPPCLTVTENVLRAWESRALQAGGG